MTYLTKTLACVSALALAVPAVAQQSSTAEESDSPAMTGENMAETTWEDVTTPSIRFIQRDNQGNIIFDSAGPELGTGVSDPELAEKIRRADGETSFATDEADEDWTHPGGTREPGANTVVELRNEPSERRARLAATPSPLQADGTSGGSQTSEAGSSATRSGSDTSSDSGDSGMMAQVDDATAPQTDGDYGTNEMFVTPSGMAIDMETFAREMFEQGYRSGYVSGMTDMRARAVRQMRDERSRMRDAYEQRARMERQGAQRQEMEQQAQQQRQEMNRALGDAAPDRPQVQQLGDGSTVILLPPGMTPQQFQRLMGGN
ncbi:hypothetical protein [Jannaschia formosa]|uniref:hypothetical protein n=1 Tax=Jannaschia formosa TaxID=2259592 RepID=UPI000E1BC030|nr:hypothetical protein [Jannaschia formosa]TFL16791.1 hypothetical protein DR046_18045 [Jannaschia formosa]